MSEKNSAWQVVTLYGVAHSPWVQGILLALNHHKIDTQLTSYPLSIRWFWRRGLVFPALKLNDGSIHVDSFRMYELLEENGFALGVQGVSTEQRTVAQVELEKLFSNYSLGRCIDGKRWRFIKGWSLMQESPSTLHGIVCRAFLSYYFWILIRLVIFFTKRYDRSFFVLAEFDAHMDKWNQQLENRKWLTGDDIGFLDFALFGQIQCMTTGLTDELLPIIKQKAHIVRWVEKMIAITKPVANGNPIYAQRIFEPQLVVESPPVWQRVMYWLVWSGYLLILPITIAIVFLGFRNRFKNPAHSGAVMSKYRQQQDRSRPPQT